MKPYTRQAAKLAIAQGTITLLALGLFQAATRGISVCVACLTQTIEYEVYTLLSLLIPSILLFVLWIVTLWLYLGKKHYKQRKAHYKNLYLKATRR